MASFEAAEEEESIEEHVDVKSSAVKRLAPGTGPPSGVNLLQKAPRSKPSKPAPDARDGSDEEEEGSQSESEPGSPHTKKAKVAKGKKAKDDEPEQEDGRVQSMSSVSNSTRCRTLMMSCRTCPNFSKSSQSSWRWNES